MSTLERAVAIAATAHAGQKDKAGEPYLLHVLRVMLRLDAEEDRIVGALHDVVEDTSWTIDDLRQEGFSENVLMAIEAVTRREDETYDEFVRRAAANDIGRRVKLADLSDNSDPSRIQEPTDRDRERMRKYARAIELLGGADRQGPRKNA